MYPSVQAWRGSQFFDDVFKLVGVPVITVQLRYDGWVTEMQVSLHVLFCFTECCKSSGAVVQLRYDGWVTEMQV